MVPEGLESDLESLQRFAQNHNLRPDWHEPDECGVLFAKCEGERLDNAHGNSPDGREMVVFVTGTSGAIRINLASLLALAARE